MDKYKFDIELPKIYRDALFALIIESRKQNRLSFSTTLTKTNGYEFYDEKEFNFPTNTTENIPLVFQTYGFICFDGNNLITLLPEAFQWYDFQQKKWFGKFCERYIRSWKDILLALVSLATLILSLHQIFGKP